MKLNEFKSLTPYPFIFKSELFSSDGLEQNKSCIKCKVKECINEENYNNNIQFKCNKKLWSFRLQTNNQYVFTINGLILENEANSHIRQYKGKYIASKKEIDRFLESIIQFDKIIENRIINTIEENFSVFHDIKTTATTVTNCAEKLITKSNGDTFEEKLENSDKELID